MAHLIFLNNKSLGRMAELVDAYALGAYGVIRVGSSPSPSNSVNQYLITRS